MRIKLTFQCDNLIVPSSYQRKLQGFIYSLVENKSISSLIHDVGFGEKRKYKLFTFSFMRGEYTYNANGHTLIFKDKFILEIASLVDDFLYEIIKSLLTNKELKLNNQKITLIEFKYIKNKIYKNDIYIKMLSPITIYQTITLNGKKRTYYYKPTDEQFSKQINQNFIRKYSTVFKGNISPIAITPVMVTDKDELIINYRGTIIKAYKGIYKLQASKKAIDFLYNTGIGSKNSMGFGMFEQYYGDIISN